MKELSGKKWGINLYIYLHSGKNCGEDIPKMMRRDEFWRQTSSSLALCRWWGSIWLRKYPQPGLPFLPVGQHLQLRPAVPAVVWIFWVENSSGPEGGCCVLWLMSRDELWHLHLTFQEKCYAFCCFVFQCVHLNNWMETLSASIKKKSLENSIWYFINIE